MTYELNALVHAYNPKALCCTRFSWNCYVCFMCMREHSVLVPCSTSLWGEGWGVNAQEPFWLVRSRGGLNGCCNWWSKTQQLLVGERVCGGQNYDIAWGFYLCSGVCKPFMALEDNRERLGVEMGVGFKLGK